jgi:hypothetical protein
VELMKQFDGRGRPEENKEGTRPNYSQAHAARDAGLSAHQQKTAVRVANVPAEQFEAAVESDICEHRASTVFACSKIAGVGTAEAVCRKPAASASRKNCS